MTQPISSAEADLRRRLATDPNNWQITCLLGELVRLRGDFTGAEPLARNAIRLRPDSGDAHRLMGLVFSQTHRTAAGEYHLRKALAIGPPTGVLLTSLALNLSSQGRYTEAAEYFDEAYHLEPSNTRFIVSHANAAELDRQYDRATELLDAAKKLSPDLLEITMVRADVLA
ncbi:pilus assembly protein, partial [bacterium]|nr:pilus assembly protein [bacterium]